MVSYLEDGTTMKERTKMSTNNTDADLMTKLKRAIKSNPNITTKELAKTVGISTEKAYALCRRLESDPKAGIVGERPGHEPGPLPCEQN